MQPNLCPKSNNTFNINLLKSYLFMNQKFKKHRMMKKALTAFVLLLAVTPVFAQGGATAISNAASDITDYWDPVKLILKAVGGLVGFIGGLRVYNKWTNGDQDVNKEILGYGGAMIFLIVVPEFVTAFFA